MCRASILHVGAREAQLGSSANAVHHRPSRLDIDDILAMTCRLEPYAERDVGDITEHLSLHLHREVLSG